MAKTPKIRFKNFSDEWENNNLGEICKIIKGEQINKLSLLENGKYYVLNGGISPSGYINTYNTLENTISISEGGNSCGYVKFNIEKFWSGGHNYTLNELKTKTLFLYSFLKAKQQKIMALRVGSGLPNIQKNTLSNISISIPNSEEQEKIGAFFSKLDKLIALHQSKFEKLQKIKKSCLQNLFPQNNQNTPKIRFKNFSDEWNSEILEKFCNIYDGTHQTPNYTNKGVMFLSVEDIKTLKSNKFISKTEFEKNYKIFPTYGDILLTRIGDIGVANVFLSFEKVAYYVSLALLKPKNVNSFFLQNSFSSDYLKNELFKRTLHIAFPKKINKNEIGKMQFKIPKNITEQEKIGAFFSKLDKLIALHQSKFEKLQKIKKSCLQKMFV